MARILAPSIRMIEQADLWLTLPQRHAQRGLNEALIAHPTSRREE
jgi:hypothetical protein